MHNRTAHLDCTYKIMTTNYNLLIFGVTDIQGKFHPVAFMIINKECEEDFIHFYSSLIKFCKDEFNFVYEPRYIMQDHNQASFNAAKHVFPKAKILMCYFHVKLNVRKNLKSKLGKTYEEFEKDLTYLHYSSSESIYQQRLNEFRVKYEAHEEEMSYMNKVWFNSVFNNWQMFCNGLKFESVLINAFMS